METGPGTSFKTMNDESQEEVCMQQDSSGETCSSDESAPLTDNIRRNYEELIAELLAQKMYDLSMETNLEDDDDCELSPDAPARGPQIPFVLNHYLDNDVDYKISQIKGLDQMVVNSPLWYSLVRPHLTQAEREILWGRVPWSVKINWSNADDDAVDYIGAATTSLLKDQNNIKL